jgi:hypothetical protein
MILFYTGGVNIPSYLRPGLSVSSLFESRGGKLLLFLPLLFLPLLFLRLLPGSAMKTYSGEEKQDEEIEQRL